MDRVMCGAWMVLAAALGACGGITVTPLGAPADAADAPDATLPACELPGLADAAPGVVLALPPACCSEAMCAPSATRCNPQTCRCEMVPCEALGAACPDGAIPGVAGPLLCAQDPGGLFCHVAPPSASACPRQVAWCLGASPCVCGEETCRFFLDRCANGNPCIPVGSWSVAAGNAAGSCIVSAPAGDGAEGAPCTSAVACAAGLLCVDAGVAGAGPRCVRPDCGFAEGAPACPSGRVCRPLGAVPLLGTCALPCDPHEVRGPCAANERCIARVDGETGYCTAVSDGPLPDVDGDCTTWCATGATCVNGRCRVACHPNAPDGDPGACKVGTRCFTAREGWYCARPCSPFSTFRECVFGDYCAPRVDSCGVVRGLCTPRPADLPKFGEACSRECDTGLACPWSPLARCLPMCFPGMNGGTGSCPTGTQCFVTRPEVPYGVCAPPCTLGHGECPEGTDCNPLSSAPDTNGAAGFCG